MQNLPSTKLGNDPILEKIFRYGFLIVLIYAGVKLFNYVAPDINEMLENLWLMAAMGIPALIIILYVLQNPSFIWMSYKNLCKKFTGFFIKMDPISYMDRYVDILEEKMIKLKQSITNLNAQKIKLERTINDTKNSMQENFDKASAAKKLNRIEQCNHFVQMGSSDKQSLELYVPIFSKMEKNLNFLEKLEENWGYSIDSLKHEIDRKKQEYLTLKETAKAIGQAQEFASGNTEEAKIYQQSVLALEESVTQKIAYIEKFEKDSKNIMQGIDLEKQMMTDKGYDLLEKYEANSAIFLPQESWLKDENLLRKSNQISNNDNSEFGNLL